MLCFRISQNFKESDQEELRLRYVYEKYLSYCKENNKMVFMKREFYCVSKKNLTKYGKKICLCFLIIVFKKNFSKWIFLENVFTYSGFDWG